MAARLLAGAAWLCGQALVAGGAKACPEKVSKRTPPGTTSEAKVAFENQTPVALQVSWVNNEGLEQPVRVIQPGEEYVQGTYVKHVFAMRAKESGALVKVYQVREVDAENSPPAKLNIKTCEGINKKVAYTGGLEKHGKHVLDKSRWEEFEQLARDHNSPCVGHSTEWSCVRQVTPQELKERDPGQYGFQKGETGKGNPYKIGTTADHIWTEQQRWIVNVTDYEGGFLKMQVTDKMKSLLYPWYNQSLKTHVHSHGDIPGFFTNAHVIALDKIEINRFPNVFQGLVQEMSKVLTWWTRQPLQHTTTFGLRIYRRGSMLLNHLDRKDTHLASAVIQVGAKADVGWPLEVIHPHKPGLVEVYLQPGEMVLYEGARVVHGRPMRFQGEEFGNIFSHFKPVGWNGPNGVENPYYWHERHKLNYPDLHPGLEL